MAVKERAREAFKKGVDERKTGAKKKKGWRSKTLGELEKGVKRTWAKGAKPIDPSIIIAPGAYGMKKIKEAYEKGVSAKKAKKAATTASKKGWAAKTAIDARERSKKSYI